MLLAVLVLLALALVTVDFRGGEGGPLQRLRGGLTAVFGPIQDGVTTLVRPIGDAASGVTELFSIRADNRHLRDRVEVLEQRHRSVTDLRRENDELRELLGLADREDLEVVAARTVSLSPSVFEWTITIDVGSNDGVERDMPVINGDGLVGRVLQVTPNASRVLLAIDPHFSAAIRSARTAEVGTVDGRGGEPMLLAPLDPGADIEVGDEIVTSSYQGGVFPGGIPIGTVLDAGDASSRLTREVQVSPFVDFTRVHHVLVVLTSTVEDLEPFDESDTRDFQPPAVDPTEGDDDPADGDQPTDPDEDPADGDRP